MNAVEHFAGLLPPPALRRLAALRVRRFETAASVGGFGAFGAAATAPGRRQLDTIDARAAVIARWGGDLCALLNAMTRGELAELAQALQLDTRGRSPELRAALWDRGAALEAGGSELAHALQPRPVILGGHLVVQAAPRGMFPPARSWPREVPADASADHPADEPDTLDELLAAADRAIGVRLGRRGRDKGAWGQRAAALLGVVERGADEPDWRGDVEVKTVPVAVDRTSAAGQPLWRVVEDPAIAMHDDARGAGAIAKLQRTLWLCRADLADGDATIVSWYLLDWDADVARLTRRYLHVRPKGPAGTDARGLYLHKRFFAEAGLLASLNGWAS
jgi:hypothetical protein